jgi:hypothetical protein
LSLECFQSNTIFSAIGLFRHHHPFSSRCQTVFPLLPVTNKNIYLHPSLGYLYANTICPKILPCSRRYFHLCLWLITKYFYHQC